MVIQGERVGDKSTWSKELTISAVSIAGLFGLAMLLDDGPSAPQSNPADAAIIACQAAAFKDYNQANLALLTSMPLMTPAARLEQRRLQEAYCARFAQCGVGNLPASKSGVPYSAAFSSCLQEEEQESR